MLAWFGSIPLDDHVCGLPGSTADVSSPQLTTVHPQIPRLRVHRRKVVETDSSRKLKEVPR